MADAFPNNDLDHHGELARARLDLDGLRLQVREANVTAEDLRLANDHVRRDMQKELGEMQQQLQAREIQIREMQDEHVRLEADVNNLHQAYEMVRQDRDEWQRELLETRNMLRRQEAYVNQLIRQLAETHQMAADWRAAADAAANNERAGH